MKTIRVNRLKPMRVRCQYCGSRLRVDPEDVHELENNDCMIYFVCPECECRNYFVLSNRNRFWARLRATK